MYKITIFYPVKENDWFDMEYYVEKHVPLSKSIFGDSLKGLAIEEAYNHEQDAQNRSYKVIGHLFFERIEEFYEKFLPKKRILEEDAKNYTSVNALIQISKVVVWDHYE